MPGTAFAPSILQLRLINPAYAQNICRAAALIGGMTTPFAPGQNRAGKIHPVRGPFLRARDRPSRAVSGRLIRLYAASPVKADLSFRHVDAIRSICAGKTGACVDLPQGFAARVDYGVLTIARAKKDSGGRDYCVPLAVEGETVTPLGVISASMVPRPRNLAAPPFECFVAAEPVVGAVVRPRKPGDTILPFGAPGKKKLKDFYIDKKIRREDRSLPVIAAGSEVLWAIGAGLSQIAAVGSQKTVLWLKFTPVETTGPLETTDGNHPIF